MLRIIVLFSITFLTACSGISPMSPESANELKKGKSIVAYFDGSERINYKEDIYWVLGVSKVESNSVYSGLWNASNDMSAIHAEELKNYNLQAKSIYDVFADDEIAYINASQKDLFNLFLSRGEKVYETSNVETKKQDPLMQLKPDFRDKLLSKGYDYFIWLTSPGFELYIHALTVPTTETINTTVWIYDLQKNKLVWDGSIIAMEELELPDSVTGKEFLEKNNLASLKKEMLKLAALRYEARTDHGVFNSSLAQKIGLEPVE